MKKKGKGKTLPILKSDKQAEDFVANADLTEYDLSEFVPVHFEFSNKTARINMRLPEALLERIRMAAEKKQIPYSRYIRKVLEEAVMRDASNV